MHPAISPSNAPAVNSPSSVPHLLSVFILFFVLFCFLSIFLFRDLLYYLSAARSSGTAIAGNGGGIEMPQNTKAGLDPAIIASFPMIRYAAVRGMMEGKCGGECAVCLTEFAAGDVIRLLTVCCHAFHPGCIDSWLVSHRTCPMCRSNLEAAPDEAAVMEVREAIARGGGRDSYVISIGEDGEGDGRESSGNTIVIGGSADERTSRRSGV